MTVMPFGRHKGEEISAIAKSDPAYLHHILAQRIMYERKYPAMLAAIDRLQLPPPIHRGIEVERSDGRKFPSITVAARATWEERGQPGSLNSVIVRLGIVLRRGTDAAVCGYRWKAVGEWQPKFISAKEIEREVARVARRAEVFVQARAALPSHLAALTDNDLAAVEAALRNAHISHAREERERREAEERARHRENCLKYLGREPTAP